MATIASLNVLLTAATGPLAKGLTQAAGMVQGFASKLGSIGAGLGSILSLATGPIGLAIGAITGVGAALKAAGEQSDAIEKLDAVLAATGNTTGFTRSQILGLADDLEKTTDFSHVAAEGAETLLASFHNIRGDSFKAALNAAADLSAVMGGDLTSNAKLIGRALENPLEGMKRLNREGIGFTVIQEQQIQAMVQAGNVAGAQAQILSGIQGKFGGAAAALASPFTQFKNQLMGIAEQVGAALKPIAKIGLSIAQPLVPMIGGALGAIIPYVQAAVGWLNTVVVAGIARIVAFVRPIWNGFTAFIGAAFSKIMDWIAPVLVSLYDTFSSEVGALVEIGTAAWGAISDGISWLAGVIGGVLNSIGINMQTTGTFFTNLRDYAQAALLVIEFGFTHWKEVGALALVSVELGLVRFANQMVYLFGTVIPGYLVWFGDNWRSILTDLVNFYVTVGENMWHNTTTIWSGIKGIFKGHGTGDFKFVSLTQGFESAIKELPHIARRNIGPLEKDLDGQLGALAGKVNQDFASFADQRTKEIGAQTNNFRAAIAGGLIKPALDKPIVANLKKPDQGGGALAEQTKTGALVRGSAEEYKARFQSERQAAALAVAQQGVALQQQQVGLLGKIAGNTDGMADDSGGTADF